MWDLRSGLCRGDAGYCVKALHLGRRRSLGKHALAFSGSGAGVRTAVLLSFRGQQSCCMDPCPVHVYEPRSWRSSDGPRTVLHACACLQVAKNMLRGVTHRAALVALLLWPALCARAAGGSGPSSNLTEAAALLAFKAQLINSEALTSWAAAADMCKNWTGVGCSAAGQVTKL